MYVYYNPNPAGNLVRDCTVRALTKVAGMTWHQAYHALCDMGDRMCDMPDSNKVFRAYLTRNGYTRHTLPNTCPDCYRIVDFCYDHPYGTYIVCTGDHVVAVCQGDYFDALNSGEEVPLYFYTKET